MQTGEVRLTFRLKQLDPISSDLVWNGLEKKYFNYELEQNKDTLLKLKKKKKLEI